MSVDQIKDWAGDIVALESHIEEALDHQLKIDVDDAYLQGVLKRTHDTVRDSKHRAEAFQESVGSTSGNQVIKFGGELLGTAAGLIGRLRNDSVAKALRDDYTAVGQLNAAYAMFYTVATAFEDEKAKEFAKTGLYTYANLVQELSDSLPAAVVYDLAANGEIPKDNTVVESVRDVVTESWRQTGEHTDS